MSIVYKPAIAGLDAVSIVSLASVGASPNANAASISSSQVLTLQPADGSNPGVLTSGAQTVGGVKTFNAAPILNSLTASLPLKLDASKNVTAAAISLSSAEVTGTLPIANGGTNSSTALTNGFVMASSAGKIVESAVTTASLASLSVIGTYSESLQTVATSAPASGTYGDAASFTLGPGTFDITGIVQVFAASGLTFASAGISTTAGNSSSGLTSGINAVAINVANEDVPLVVPNVRVTPVAPTTYYLKLTANFSSGVVYKARISAVQWA